YFSRVTGRTCSFSDPGRLLELYKRAKVNKNTLNNRFLFMKRLPRMALYRKMGTKTGIYKQKCSVSWVFVYF
ncbi:MAG: hypothetical protein IJM24_01285, partial [Clostridia bacterium]|nr:hypothetical protein [Clostridia bacterium]